MRFLLLLVTYLLVLPASSHDDDDEFYQLEEQFEEYRTRLALIPEELFQLELAIDLLELVPKNGSTVKQVDVAGFREKFASVIFNLVEDLFDLEADLRELYQDREVREKEPVELDCSWRLAMNLNPTDGHIMHYITGWSGTSSIGTVAEALQKDYLNQEVWYRPANYIAIVRHQNGAVEAVKTFKYVSEGYSLKEMFNSSNSEFYRQVVGVNIQAAISTSAIVTYDPIFSVGGHLAINWGWNNNGVRMVLTDGYLEPAVGVDSYKTRGLGAHYYFNPVSGTSVGTSYDSTYGMEIGSTRQHSSYHYAIGTDYGTYSYLRSTTSAYGQYAIYVSEDADTFPGPGSQLQLEVEGHC